LSVLQFGKMIRALRIGDRHFKPGLLPAIAAAAFIVLTIALGNWQTRRAEEKLELGRRLDAAARGPVLQVPTTRVDPTAIDRRRVSAHGSFVPRATLYLDNQVLHGVAGYDVLTPLKLGSGPLHVLVNRGWIAAGDRAKLPEVPTPESEQTIEGIAFIPSRRIFELGPEADSGPLLENLVVERLEKRLGVTLQPFVIEQTTYAHDGLAREWRRPDLGVERNRGYALQWYSFAALAAALYVILSFKKIDATRK
jgi:surfeit locus 1 family protein